MSYFALFGLNFCYLFCYFEIVSAQIYNSTMSTCVSQSGIGEESV